MMLKITAHLKQTGEFGQGFPISLSSFNYSDTVAQENFPQEELPQQAEEAKYFGPKYRIPHGQVDQSICERILQCEVSGKNYKIIPQEYQFYQYHQLPLPRQCPDQRYLELKQRRNPQALSLTRCECCKRETATTYAEEIRPKIIFCEQCYLKELY